MGFYLRKSFSAGPLRLNLSKSGLGVSLGVPGARVGISSTGRGYVQAGCGGLYFRKSLGSPSTDTSASRLLETGLSEPEDPFTISADTNVTYPLASIPSSSLPTLESTLRRTKLSVAIYLLFPTLAVIVGAILRNQVFLSPQVRTFATIVLAALLSLWPVPMIHAWRKNRRGEALGTRLDERFSTTEELSPTEIAELRSAISDPRITDSDREYYEKTSYLNVLERIVTDGRVSDEEKALLHQIRQLCNLTDAFSGESHLNVFRKVYLDCVADHELTEEEEEALRHIREALEIAERAVLPELGFVEHLKEIRSILSGALEPIKPTVSLPEGEVCYHQGDARLLKIKTVRSFQSAGQRYKVRAPVVEKEGVLLITDKRLLLIHDGTTSIPLKKLLHVQLDYDRNLLALTKDGSSSALYITTPDAYRASAILSVLGR